MNETTSGLPGPVKSTSGSEDIQLPIVMYYNSDLFSSLWTYLCVSECVCEREREREIFNYCTPGLI